jgi:hypothetical protein
MSPAERQRRRRQRQRAGDMVVREIIVSRQSREVLNEARWLRDWDDDDPDALRRAVQALVDGLRPVTRDGSG